MIVSLNILSVVMVVVVVGRGTIEQFIHHSTVAKAFNGFTHVG